MLTSRGFCVFESENGALNRPVCVANGPDRGDGFIISHGARKPNPVCRHAPLFDTRFHDGQHADLLEILHRLASSAGARVRFGVPVESVEAAQETPPGNDTTSTSIAGFSSRTLQPTVRLKNGEILHADVIIGADGRRSIVRRVVIDEDEEPEATSLGLSMYTGCVPMAEVRKYAPLRQLVEVGWQVWIGDGRVVLGASSSFTIPAC